MCFGHVAAKGIARRSPVEKHVLEPRVFPKDLIADQLDGNRACKRRHGGSRYRIFYSPEGGRNLHLGSRKCGRGHGPHRNHGTPSDLAARCGTQRPSLGEQIPHPARPVRIIGLWRRHSAHLYRPWPAILRWSTPRYPITTGGAPGLLARRTMLRQPVNPGRVIQAEPRHPSPPSVSEKE